MHRLLLRHVKGVTDRVVDFPDEGVVVVEGDNEVGKTSMVEALDLLFDEKDSSRKRHVLAMRPVGLDVPSVVEAEISSGAYRFTYRKQWFRQPGTVLTVTSPRREELTGTAAHDRAQEILAASTDVELWRAMRLLQATPLTTSDLSASRALASALEQAAGARAGAGSAGDTLLAACEEEYRAVHTATGRPTGAWRVAREEHEAARLEVEAARGEVEAVAEDVAGHARIVAELSHLGERLTCATAEFDEATREWDEVSILVRAADEASAAVAAARTVFDAAAERLADRARAVEDVATCREQVRERADALDVLTADGAPDEKELTRCVEERADALARQAEARRQASRAESDVALRADLADLAALEGQVRRIEEALDERRRAREEVARERVDRAGWTTVEAAAREVELRRAEQRAGSATWLLERLGEGGAPVPVSVDGQARLVESEPLEGAVGEPVEIAVQELVRLRLVPPVGAAGAADAVESATRRLAEALEAVGTRDVEAARLAHDRHVEAAERLRAAERALSDGLAGESVDEVRERHEAVRRHVDELVAQRVGDALDPDVGVLRAVLSAAREAEESARAEVARLDGEVMARRDDVDRRRLRRARAESAVEAAQAVLDAAVRRLAVARERVGDAELERAVALARLDLAAATERSDALRAQVETRDPDSVRVRLDGAASAAGALRRRRRAASDERVAIEARLRLAGEQGRGERLTQADARLAHARRQLDLVERRATAARTLREALQRHHAAVTQSYVEPFGQAVARLGRVVYGPGFEVEVGASLEIEARVLDDRRIPYASLSTGAKEQLAILTRLACAQLVDPDEGAPVILDDALGYADPVRLRRVCSAFSLVGSGTQIILLTCTPGRYDAIPGAHVIRL